MLYLVVTLVVISLGLGGLVYFTRLENQRLAAESESLKEQHEQALAESEAANSKISELETEFRTVASAKTSLESNIAELEDNLKMQLSRLGDLQTENEEYKVQLQDAELKIVDLAARPDVVLNEIAANATNNASALWELELVRSERAWRNSVAINPVTDVSPFVDAEDPVRLAIEVEASALREDVGAYVTIDWQAKSINDPARRHLVVRVAQELLATAARSPGASKLVVVGEDDLKLKLEAVSESDGEINLIPPQINNDLVDISDDDGLTVTVKS